MLKRTMALLLVVVMVAAELLTGAVPAFAANTADMTDLAMATAVYGYHAKQYFG